MGDTVALTCHLGAQEAQESILTCHISLTLLYNPQNKHFPPQSDIHIRFPLHKTVTSYFSMITYTFQ
jgi:hypothetical protein